MGQRIKACRKECKLTREELAGRVEISPHYLYEIERGSKAVSVVILARLVEELGTTSDYIIFGKESRMVTDYSTGSALEHLLVEVPVANRERVMKMVEAVLPFMTEQKK